jgi:hypothetical protein
MKRFRVVVGPVDNKRIYLITSPSEEAVRRDLRDVLSVEEEPYAIRPLEQISFPAAREESPLEATGRVPGRRT